MNTKRAIFFIFGIILTMFFTSCGHFNKSIDDNSQADTPINKGEHAPLFSMKDLNGNIVTLADLSNKKVYVKYWASWCSMCLAGLEEIDALAGEDNEFEIITIVSPNFNGEKSTEDFQRWFSALPYDDLTVLLDEDGKWAEEFKVLAYPSSYYIGSDGILVKTIVGHNPSDIIINELNEIY